MKTEKEIRDLFKQIKETESALSQLRLELKYESNHQTVIDGLDYFWGKFGDTIVLISKHSDYFIGIHKITWGQSISENLMAFYLIDGGALVLDKNNLKVLRIC